MSWKSIAGNQTISRETLQNAVDTGVFVQKAPIPSGYATKQITKEEANSYISTWELYPSYRSKALNQLPVKSDLAVQSNILYGGITTIINLGNNDRTWSFPILSIDGGQSMGLASSVDNRCILLGRWHDKQGSTGFGSAVVSSNGGETFSLLGSVVSVYDSVVGVGMSNDGGYMVMTRQKGSTGSSRASLYYSYNSGANWVQSYPYDGNEYWFNGAAMSGNGVYATVLGSDGTNFYVFRSTSFGSSWTKSSALCGGAKSKMGSCVAMSKSGQYQLVVPPTANSPHTGSFFKSNDWGESWTEIAPTPVPLLPVNTYYGCSVSSGGDYMTVSGYSSGLGQSVTLTSNDWGATWTFHTGVGNQGQAVDSSGQFQFQLSAQSTDYGSTWTSSANNGYAISLNQTTNGKPYMYGIPYSVSYAWQSATQGESFSSLTNSPTGNLTYIAKSRAVNDGKYVGVVKNFLDNTWKMYTSSDYGANWETHFSSNGEEMRLCAVSDDGVYWLTTTYNPSNYTFYIWRSTDSGATWQYTYVSYIGTPVDCAISNDGKYMTIIYQGNGAGYSDNVINSTNYGASWAYASAPPNSSGRMYNSIAMSKYGRWRMMAVTDDGLTGCRIFYSGNYGVNWAEKAYISGYYATSIATDDTGKVGIIAVAKADNTDCRLYYTTIGWDDYIIPYYSTFHAPMAEAPIVNGVNISSDATYWTAVSYNVPYSFTSISAGYSWTINNIGTAIDKLTK